jgi:hypothetical protein
MRPYRCGPKWRSALVAVAVAGISCATHADDAAPGVPLPPLRMAPAGALRTARAALQIDGRHVRLTLALEPRGQDTAVALSWTSANIAWTGYGETYPDRRFPELAFEIDGTPASMASRDEARLRTDDISALLATAGIDPFSITQTPPFVVPRAGANGVVDPSTAKAAHAELLRRGAIENAKEGELAKWTARRHIELALAPGAHGLGLAYDARPGIETATRAALLAPSTARRYCILATAVPKGIAAGGWIIERYDLPASLDNAPSGQATIEIAADPKAEAARWFACGAGGRGIVVDGALAQIPVQADAQGIVHVMRLSSANPG